jgi:hypothetical protein
MSALPGARAVRPCFLSQSASLHLFWVWTYDEEFPSVLMSRLAKGRKY